MQLRIVLGAIALVTTGLFAAEPIPRSLPPIGIEVPEKDRAEILAELEKVQYLIRLHAKHPFAPDAEVATKAVDFALQYREFYQPRDIERARTLLREVAAVRINALANGDGPSWARSRGRVVRGFRSNIDDSVQPYGLVIPEDFDFSKPAPLYVWLHGRGDKQTDLHFIQERLTRDGQIKPPGAIVLHPFGRHCLGFKSAGETDVLEAIEHVQKQYKIDPNRIVLMGFSMGGAGAWHLGAHYTDRFVAISPGAGFAETARYQRLPPDQYPPHYEQTLWGMYDVPGYARNLFNRPVVAYSGEMDRQIQAARVMEEAFQSHGRELKHYIGPGMGHQYHPETLNQILADLAEAVKKGRPENPTKVSLQTRTLRYNRMDWVEAMALDQHWLDSRIDAEILDDTTIQVTTQNVSALRLSPKTPLASTVIELDGVKISMPRDFEGAQVGFVRDPVWRWARGESLTARISKRPGLQGPIDDAFLEPFLVVAPTGKSAHPQIESWVATESAHLQERWRMVFRGDLRVKKDVDVSVDDFSRYHIVAWGTPESNSVLGRAYKSDVRMPVQWSQEEIHLGDQSWNAATHVSAFIYPNPMNNEKYLVVNSGPTFREAHDRTNSLQNPKLPDWAVIDVTVPPSAEAPGKIVAADFFDEKWRVKDQKR